MTLAFLVASIFGGLAYIANLNVKYIESKSNMIVFFNVGMDPEVINSLKQKWEGIIGIQEITYLSEEQAFQFYADYTSKVVPEIYQVLSTYEEHKLPSSLEIKLESLNNVENIASSIQSDIDSELQKLVIVDLDPIESVSATDGTTPDGGQVAGAQDSRPSEVTNAQDIKYKYEDETEAPPISLAVDNDNLNKLKDVFFKLRIAGIGALSLLFVFVAIFIFMTVEFRLYNQKDEIGVMQLVGGSLFFIRAPYIIEGGFYGFFGALLSTIVLGAALFSTFVVYKDSTITQFLYENFGQLPWPELNGLLIAGLILAMAGVGFFLGAISSYFSIRRYIR